MEGNTPKPIKGSINIHKAIRPTYRNITSKSTFFSEPIVYDVKDGCIYFKRANLWDTNKVLYPYQDKKNKHFHISIPVGYEDVYLGKYNFEDDSNEDCVIIYYKKTK